MEGFGPLPKAEHPFPDNPNLNKFWGGYSKPFFKSFGVFLIIYGTFAAATLYTTRNQKGLLGFDLSRTEEEMEMLKKKQDILMASQGLSQNLTVSGPIVVFDV